MDVKQWNFNVKNITLPYKQQDLTEPSACIERILFTYAHYAVEIRLCQRFWQPNRIIIHASEEKMKERKYQGL